jgi:hypothetical protein
MEMKHEMKRLSTILQLLKAWHLPVPGPVTKNLRSLRLQQRRRPEHLLHAHALVRARSWPPY